MVLIFKIGENWKNPKKKKFNRKNCTKTESVDFFLFLAKVAKNASEIAL